MGGRAAGRSSGRFFFGSILADSGDAFCCGRRPSERLVFRVLEEANRTVGVGGVGSRGDGLALRCKRWMSLSVAVPEVEVV